MVKCGHEARKGNVQSYVRSQRGVRLHSPVMALECLVLTRDAVLLTAIKSRLDEFGIRMFVRNDAVSAIELSNRHHLDGFVVDCDDVSGGTEALKRVVISPANKRSVLLAVTNGRTSLTEAFEMGAQFVMNKPVQDE